MSRTSQTARALVACCALLIGGCSTMSDGEGQLASAQIDSPATTAESTGYARAMAGWATGKLDKLGSIVMAPARAMFSKRTQSSDPVDGMQAWKADDPRVEMISVVVAPDLADPGSRTTIALNY